ncbi:DUF2779 domain-containing protein [Flavobacterium sp.]|jgi:hypothetical protein|uniref:DUF2779 domain-containing protein n=1 Tax=Flavobacterium sp. TaxID=239 RepID=UPI0037BFFDE0
MISKTLSKSDFQLASDCPKKLIYKKQGYPTSNDTNEYMEMLAQGGYVVGTMATMLYPDGIEITGNTSEAVQKTLDYLKLDNVVLFEPAVMTTNQKLCRIDILVKQGNDIQIIEVKAKSHNSEDNPADSAKKLKKYIEDIAYQYHVFHECFPNYTVQCFLLTPNKSKRTTIDGLAGWFSTNNSITANTIGELEGLPAQQQPRFNKPEVLFRYENDVKRADYIQQLKNEGILDYVDVTQKVLEIQPYIVAKANQFVRILEKGIQQSDFCISKKCKSCEFNSREVLPNGYLECWGNEAETKPHIFDLYNGGSIGHYTKGFYLDELISNEKTSLYDIDFERLKNTKGELSTRGQRQLIQIEKTRLNEEWISDSLKSLARTFEYPLHFIDFETYTGALPFYKGMRPYELIAFQWSCHTINSPGAVPINTEWFQENSSCLPNFEFALALKKQIGTTGTPFMWATHENTVLRTICKQMDLFDYKNDNLFDWLIGITTDKELNRQGRLVDMNKLTLDHYFHPDMKGKTSIKKVLPAIWNNNDYLHSIPYFSKYAAKDFTGGIIDPYDTLTAGIDFENTDDDVVKGGTAAIRAYNRILFDNSIGDNQKNELKHQLLRYCELDTMAMVIIGYNWGIR